MNVQSYLERREELKNLAPKFKVRCGDCLQPQDWCYCANLEPFDCGITFVILLHPLELRRRIASGRMSHLMLKDSHLILGHNYSDDLLVNQLLADSNYYPMILCLGENSKNLSSLSESEKAELCPSGKRPLIFVIDGTWGTASKTVRLSKNLNTLPRISFTPTKPSAFRVRQQPKENCYSTLEAIHQTIDLLGESRGFDISSKKHDRLLKVFDSFVTKQVNYLKDLKARDGTLHYRRKYSSKC